MNTAYKTLLSPMERIAYVLQRNGKEVGEGEGMEDMELMVEVMEAREAIEESDGEGLGRLREANDGKVGGTTRRIEEAVGAGDWAAARACAVRLRYLLGVADAIRQRAENAG